MPSFWEIAKKFDTLIAANKNVKSNPIQRNMASKNRVQTIMVQNNLRVFEYGQLKKGVGPLILSRR